VSADPTTEEEAIAAAVEAGTDTIAVPAELLEERATPPEPTLLQRIQAMSIAEKIKLALRGNREARVHLIRDPNRLIRRFVLQNPRLGEDEILMLAKNRSTDDELLRLIAASREWTRNYQIRFALVTNPKTPIALALRFVGALADRDVRGLAKSKNVPTAVANAAKRIILQKGP
jgi:hypothetical protein